MIKEKKNIKGNLTYKDLKWSIPKKKLTKDIHKIGDIIFVKKNNNSWLLKQYPRVNGGIVVLDPFSGDVLALVGGFNFKKSEFNRVTQAKDNQDLHLNQLYMLLLRKRFCTKFNNSRRTFCRKSRSRS